MEIPLETEQHFKDVVTDMFAEAFRIENPIGNRLLKTFLTFSATRSARVGLRYDALIKEHQTVKIASQWLADYWSESLAIEGVDRVPTSGPLLLVANHPGMGDAVSIFASIPRRDVYTFVKVRTLLNALPNFLSYCVVMNENKPMLALRETIRRLRMGQTVLLFPHGEMESDPAVDLAEAQQSATEWSKSIMTMARAVPDLNVLPVAVGGVVSKSAYNSPLCRIYRNPDFRNYLAATLQIMYERYRDIDVKVAYGTPVSGEEITLPSLQTQMNQLLVDVSQS